MGLILRSTTSDRGFRAARRIDGRWYGAPLVLRDGSSTRNASAAAQLDRVLRDAAERGDADALRQLAYGAAAAVPREGKPATSRRLRDLPEVDMRMAGHLGQDWSREGWLMN